MTLPALPASRGYYGAEPRPSAWVLPEEPVPESTLHDEAVALMVLAGPRAGGGPHRVQLWARDGRGEFARLYAGPGPVRSPYLGAWLVVTEGGRRLRVSDDRAGQQLWPTAEEAERAAKEAERVAKEAERAAKEAERAAKEAALAENERLRAELEALQRRLR